MAIQPLFGAHGPQCFLGGEQKHPERIRVQLAQPVQGHQHGLQVILLIEQQDQILGKGLHLFAAEVRSHDCVYIIGQLSHSVNDLNRAREF